jgi:HAE1 family hydrophobic/amphiphilic exporter-1/multidrug efflux pump
MLKRGHLEPGKFFGAFNRWFARVTDRYEDGVAWMIRRGIVGVVLFLGMVAITIGLWRFTPGSLVPDEDQGWFITAVILPDGATLQRTDKVVGEVVEIIKSNPANGTSSPSPASISGGFRNNAASIFVTQKHWDERKMTSAQLVGEVFMKTGHIKEALVLAFNPPPIFGLGTAGGFEFYLQNRGEGGSKRMAEVLFGFLGKANADPVLGGVQTLWRATVPQLSSMSTARRRGAGRADHRRVRHAGGALGNFYVNDFNRFGRTWRC